MKVFGYSRDIQGNPVVREGDVKKEIIFHTDGPCLCVEQASRGVGIMCEGCTGPLPVFSHTDADV